LQVLYVEGGARGAQICTGNSGRSGLWFREISRAQSFAGPFAGLRFSKKHDQRVASLRKEKSGRRSSQKDAITDANVVRECPSSQARTEAATPGIHWSCDGRARVPQSLSTRRSGFDIFGPRQRVPGGLALRRVRCLRCALRERHAAMTEAVSRGNGGLCVLGASAGIVEMKMPALRGSGSHLKGRPVRNPCCSHAIGVNFVC